MAGYGDTQYLKAFIGDADYDIKAVGAYIGATGDSAGLSFIGSMEAESNIFFSSIDDDGVTMMAEPFMNHIEGSEKMNDEVVGRAVEFEIQAVGLDDIAKIVTAQKIDDLHGQRKFVYMYDADTGFVMKSTLLKIKSTLEGKGNATPVWKLSGTQEADGAMTTNTLPPTEITVPSEG